MAKSAAATNDGERRGVRSAMQRFREYLRGEQLRFTDERRSIARALFDSDQHLEAEELLARLRKSGARASRATVYRTLDLLVQAGLARKVRLGADHNYFEHILGRRQHEHMVCVACGEVIEWFDPELEELLERNSKRQGFLPTRHTVQIFGHCADCHDDRG